MSVIKRLGLGIKLYVDAAGGTSWSEVASVVDKLDGPNAKADIVNIPLMSEEFLDKAKGQIDAGDVTYTIAYSPEDSDTVDLKALLLQTTPTPTWRITYPATVAEDIFQGHLSAFSPKRGLKNYVVADVTIAVVGAPG